MLLPAEIYTKNQDCILPCTRHDRDSGFTANSKWSHAPQHAARVLISDQKARCSGHFASVFLSWKLKLRVQGDHAVIHSKTLCQRDDICMRSPAARRLPAQPSCHLNEESVSSQETLWNVSPGHTTKRLVTLSVILAELKAGDPDRSELFISCAWFCFTDWNNLMKFT